MRKFTDNDPKRIRGKMSLTDAREMYEVIMKEQILSEYKFPSKPSSDGFYHIYILDPTKKSGRRQIKGSTLEILKNKVYEFEKGEEGSARKTFKEVFNICMDLKLRRTKSKERKLSAQNSVNRIRQDYKRYFEGTRFENLYIDEITKKDIEKIYEANLSKYDLKLKAALALRGIIKRALDLAYSEDWIETNPYERVDFEKFQMMIIDDTPVEERVHSSSDVESILSYTRAYQKKKESYIPAYALEFQILIGGRRGELPALKWSDVHDNYIFIHDMQITVVKNGDKKETFALVGHTKTSKNRMFPITSEIKDLLTRLKTVDEKYFPSSDFLFPCNTSPTGAITNNVVYRYYRRTLKNLGIEKKPGVIMGTHSFRRNAITNVANLTGGNLTLASKLFGNSPQVANKNYYTGIDIDKVLEILEK